MALTTTPAFAFGIHHGRPVVVVNVGAAPVVQVPVAHGHHGHHAAVVATPIQVPAAYISVGAVPIQPQGFVIPSQAVYGAMPQGYAAPLGYAAAPFATPGGCNGSPGGDAARVPMQAPLQSPAPAGCTGSQGGNPFLPRPQAPMQTPAPGGCCGSQGGAPTPQGTPMAPAALRPTIDRMNRQLDDMLAAARAQSPAIASTVAPGRAPADTPAGPHSLAARIQAWQQADGAGTAQVDPPADGSIAARIRHWRGTGVQTATGSGSADQPAVSAAPLSAVSQGPRP